LSMQQTILCAFSSEKKVYLLLSLVCLGFLIPGVAYAQTSTFSATGSVQYYTVPAGATSIGVDIAGGAGGAGGYGNSGKGGRVQVTMNVTPAQVYSVYVGNIGIANGANSGTWGYNGLYYGGNGVVSSYSTGGGGAGTEIWFGGSVILVAGGGGSTGGDCTSDYGGPGGGTTGVAGKFCNAFNTTYCGQGGTQTAGGAAGTLTGCGGTAGSRGTGGNGGQSCTNWAGAGGGGYYGGGGAIDYGGGGGGSSYPAAVGGNITALAHTQGYQAGAGYATFTVLCQAPGSITGTLTVCQGATTSLSNPTGASGGTWTSSNPAAGTISAGGVVTGIGPGTTTITYVLSSPCGSNATAVVTVNPVAGAITGTGAVCMGGGSTLSATPGGGTFTSGSTGVATIGASSGIVASVGPGTSTITYSLGNGCATSSTVFTVNAQPASITGTFVVCGGTVPTSSTLSDATSGGTWSSSSPATGSISGGGVVTGVSSGTTTISYTLATGCFSTQTVTVNAVANITGTPSACLGNTTNLADATSGGAWSSSNTSVGTVGTSGIVYGVSLGTTNISYTVASIGCSAFVLVNVTNPPSPYTVTGGGAYCAGGSGVHIGLNNSNSGISYTLYNGASIAGTGSGTGSAIDFGLFTASGTYTAVAAPGTACSANMLGSVTVTVNPLPTAFTVAGGGAYCAGGTGVSVTTSSSTIGVNYQLMLGGTTIGSPIVGTSGALTFPAVTTAGTYSVTAVNATTGCVNGMAGTAVVSINPLPTVFSMTGGGGFCLGASGVHVGLGGSITGTSYQLFLGGSATGAPLAGTGSALDFGLITTAGNYTVVATIGATGCSTSMSGVATVVINPLPTIFTVTGGGAYCLGGAGAAVGLNGSAIGVNYQLFNGASAVGSAVPGIGAAISFGLQTAAGSYTVVATNATTGCINNMFGSVSVSISPLPTVFNVTGGGGYCAGGTGVHIGLSGSTVGSTYQLFNGATLVSAASGTGAALDFGLFTSAGTYTVTGLNTGTGCTGNMSGSVTVTINPLPLIFNVTGGGQYCAGGTGVAIGLSGSATGVNYQLFNGGTPIGSVVAGSGGVITFGLQTGAGSYSVMAINPATTCSSNMSGSAVITINPLPTVYSVTGGGGYCAGGTGTHVGLAASNTGINYQLFNGGTGGAILAGTGAAIDFGLQTATGTYTVSATNTVTACTASMSGSAVININSLPTVYSVTGGGNYCAGGTGMAVGVFSSVAGTNYQLFNGGTPVGGPVAGTGSAISFGNQTAAGIYTVVATIAATSCSANMSGSVTIGISALPAVFTVTGGGAYCNGGAGMHVGLISSATGINYQLYRGVTLVGTPVPGTGGALDFGSMTVAGTYTVVASDAITGCSANMTGSATISINPLPALNTVTGGGGYCAGGTGAHIGLNGSVTGISYQLYNGVTPSGSPMVGTALPLDFGLKTAAGTYSVKATNIVTGCQSTMTGTATININALPIVHNVTGGGSYCVGGTGMDIALDGSDLGITYQLFNGGTPVGTPMTGTSSPLDFGFKTATGIYTVVATNTGSSCTSNMAGSATIGTYPLPLIYNVTGGGNFCAGGTGVHVGLSGSNTGVMYQLINGGPVGAPVAGTGTAIDFGLQTTAGSYTVVATKVSTGCTANMNGAAAIGVSALPNAFNVTGGGDYCAGAAGLNVGLDGSATGVNYQLLLAGSPVGSPMAGTGSAINFGLKTAAGNYTVLATNTGTTCINTMAGSVNIAIDPLPNPYTLTGGGNYCSGGAGVDISLAASDAGISYQLYTGGSPSGLPVAGTGSGISFGYHTTAGLYMVVATNSTTGCTTNITGVTVVVNPLPTAYIVSGGGAYCATGTGVHVTLSGSNAGITYQLMLGGSPIGGTVPGTGSGLDFGPQTAGGNYTVQATNNTTHCQQTMTGSVNVTVNPLPTPYAVSSTSSTYCAGGPGVHIWLNTSDAGINYQLYNGSTTVGLPIPGTGTSVDFGFHLTPGSYSVVGVNTVTGCMNTMMLPAVTIVVNPLPTTYTVTGGGAYCAGGNGVHVGLSSSTTGISYQLLLAGLPVGTAMAGTGGTLDFGLQLTTGNYTVAATNTFTTCNTLMSGSVNVATNALPLTYTITGGGSYCAGGTGVTIGLSGSNTGVSYQLMRGATAVGSPMTGTGSSLSFGAWTGAGTYKITATNITTGCTNDMTGTVTISVNPAPTSWSVIGGGNYCPGGTGVHVGLSGSNVGNSYQLMLGGTATGLAIGGTGTALDFGLQTASGNYTVMATNTTTGCTGLMSGSVNIGINPLPAAYAVIGGGNYCAGGSGVHVGTGNSNAGINYVLYNGFSAVATMPGTGGPVDFGLQTAAGTYTVQATNAATGCSNWMTGSVSIAINPLVTPTVAIVTAHDTICDGTFTTFNASATNAGTSPLYQWTVNGSPSAAGSTYSYTPSNGDVIVVTLTSSATCATPAVVSSTKIMTVDPHQSPAVIVSANPGTIVCQSTSVTFTAGATAGGATPAYTWFKNNVNSGSGNTYTYIPVNGDVVYVMLTSSYHCATTPTANSSHLAMEVDAPTAPVVTISPNPGLSIASGQTLTLTATVANGGPTPSYQWLVNGIAIPGATTPTFVYSNYNDGDSATCHVLSSGGCPGLLGFNSVAIHVHGVGVKPVTAAGSDIRLMPNPNKGIFTVKGTLGSATDEEVTMEITDMLGQVVYSSKVMTQNGAINEQITLNNKTANGMYLLTLRSGTEHQVFHLVIEQ
jgi:Secretion system C-terminal sorting domain